MRSSTCLLLALAIGLALPALAGQGAGVPLVIPERTLLVDSGPVPEIRIGPLTAGDGKGRRFYGPAVAVLEDRTEVPLDATLKFSGSLLRCAWKVKSRKGALPAVSCRIRASMEKGSFRDSRGGWRSNQSPRIAVADLDGDGVSEILISDPSEHLVRVVNEGLTVITELWTGAAAHNLLVADLNADGRVDIVASQHYADSACIFLNTTEPWPGGSPPTFAPRATFSAASTPRQVEAADFDRDGRPDLVFATHDTLIDDSTRLTVLRNLTEPGAETPEFEAPRLLDVLGRTCGFATADLDRDGWSDLVAPETSEDDEYYLGFFGNARPDGTGPSFRARADLPVQDAPKGYIVPRTADLNLDGAADLFLLRYFWPNPVVAVNLTPAGAGEPVLLPVDIPGAGTATDARIADLNWDGRPDVVLLDHGNGAFRILLNRTEPGETAPRFRTIDLAREGELEYWLDEVAVGDVTGDGWPDIVTAARGAGEDLDSVQQHRAEWRHSGFRLKYRSANGKKRKVTGKDAATRFR